MKTMSCAFLWPLWYMTGTYDSEVQQMEVPQSQYLDRRIDVVW